MRELGESDGAAERGRLVRANDETAATSGRAVRAPVVIAGCGAISAVGCGIEPLLAALKNNSSGLRVSEKFPAPRFQSNIVGAALERGRLARANDETTATGGRAVRAPQANPAWHLAAEALRQACAAAKNVLEKIPAERIALVLSTTKANITALELCSSGTGFQPVSSEKFSADKHPRLTGKMPVPLRHLRADLLAEDLAKEFGARGPVQTVSVACVSGLVAISQGAKIIQRGAADAVLVVGVDALSEFVVAGFTALKALDPLGCRPFDAARCGLSPGEAGAAVVLVGQASRLSSSKNQHQLDRQDACPTIRIRAFGSSNDANHLTGPSRDGSGLAQAIRVALDAAKLSPAEIDFIHAHGTGTPYNDAMESLAIKTIFGDACPPVSGAKGMLGHTLGAAGVIETICCVLAMQNNFLPGTPRLSSPADGAPASLVREPRSAARLKNVLKLNTGFGGMNGALILQNYV